MSAKFVEFSLGRIRYRLTRLEEEAEHSAPPLRVGLND